MNFRVLITILSLLVGLGQVCQAMNKRVLEELFEDKEYLNLIEEIREKDRGKSPPKKTTCCARS